MFHRMAKVLLPRVGLPASVAAGWNGGVGRDSSIPPSSKTLIAAGSWRQLLFPLLAADGLLGGELSSSVSGGVAASGPDAGCEAPGHGIATAGLPLTAPEGLCLGLAWPTRHRQRCGASLLACGSMKPGFPGGASCRAWSPDVSDDGGNQG